MKTHYEVANAGPEVRGRVRDAKDQIRLILHHLNLWLIERDLEMHGTLCVRELRDDAARPCSQALKTMLSMGLVSESEQAHHAALIKEAEAREKRRKERINRRNE